MLWLLRERKNNHEYVQDKILFCRTPESCFRKESKVGGKGLRLGCIEDRNILPRDSIMEYKCYRGDIEGLNGELELRQNDWD